MVYDLDKFHCYLLGNKFIFYVDHMALLYLVWKPQVSRIIARWLLLFLEYNFSIIYKLGRFHIVANALSWMLDLTKKKWSTRPNNECSTFPLTTNVVIRNFRVFHYQKNSNLVWLKAKEEANLESFTFFFGIGQIVSSRLRPSFEVLFFKTQKSP